jgi:hypothetical protein
VGRPTLRLSPRVWGRTPTGTGRESCLGGTHNVPSAFRLGWSSSPQIASDPPHSPCGDSFTFPSLVPPDCLSNHRIHRLSFRSMAQAFVPLPVLRLCPFVDRPETHWWAGTASARVWAVSDRCPHRTSHSPSHPYVRNPSRSILALTVRQFFSWKRTVPYRLDSHLALPSLRSPTHLFGAILLWLKSTHHYFPPGRADPPDDG